MATQAPTQSRDPRPVLPLDGGNGAPANHGHDPDEVDLNVPHPRPAWVVAAFVVAALAIAALLLTGLIPRVHQQKELNAEAHDAANAPVLVNAVRPKRGPTTLNVTIPGTLRPWQEVSLFARTNGYLKKYYFDISQTVEAGKVMADIDAPEVDQELAQAKASLLQAQANVIKVTADRDLAQRTLKRYAGLKDTQGITEQALEERKGAVDVAESMLQSATASVTASEANVRRLTEMQGFQKIVAPFTGVVTGRAYDVGSLISANPTAADVRPMFKIAQNDVLRAFVNVPQSAALQVKKGMEVGVSVRERPNHVYTGYVMGTTNYLDPASRSLLTEIKIANPKEPDGTFSLLPGMYCQANFSMTRDAPPLVLPGPAIVANAEGIRVAVIDDQGVARFKKVVISLDRGTEVEITSGLSGDEKVIANPGERVVEGAAVTAANDPGPPAAAPTAPTARASATTAPTTAATAAKE